MDDTERTIRSLRVSRILAKNKLVRAGGRHSISHAVAARSSSLVSRHCDDDDVDHDSHEEEEVDDQISQRSQVYESVTTY